MWKISKMAFWPTIFNSGYFFWSTSVDPEIFLLKTLESGEYFTYPECHLISSRSHYILDFSRKIALLVNLSWFFHMMKLKVVENEKLKVLACVRTHLKELLTPKINLDPRFQKWLWKWSKMTMEMMKNYHENGPKRLWKW